MMVVKVGGGVVALLSSSTKTNATISAPLAVKLASAGGTVKVTEDVIPRADGTDAVTSISPIYREIHSVRKSKTRRSEMTISKHVQTQSPTKGWQHLWRQWRKESPRR